MQRIQLQAWNWWFAGLAMFGILITMGVRSASSSDHLDTPTVIADPAADIGDIFAWTSSDGKRLNLVMDIVAHQFSDRLQFAEARTSYELLLSRDPMAFADHGAEFYLGPGADPERAWILAQQNLANRQTPRAAALAIKAAEASGHYADACALLLRFPDSVKSVQLQIWSPDPRIGPSVRPSGGKGAFDPHHAH